MAKTIEMTRDMLINGEARLYASSYARCLNPDCDDFGGIADTESPDVCCDGPWAIYVAATIEDAKGTVLARSPDDTREGSNT